MPRRRTVSRVLAVLAVSVAVGVAVQGCAHRGGDGAGASALRKPGSGGTERRVELPKPYALPAEAPLAIHLAQPSEIGDAVRELVGPDLAMDRVLVRAFEEITTPELAATLANAIDRDQPWAAARFTPEGAKPAADGSAPAPEELARFTIRASDVGKIQDALASLTPAGRFGARVLPEGQTTGRVRWASTQWLVWLDGNQLALAHDERGLVTTRDLVKTYGRSRIDVAVAGDLLPAMEVPVRRLSLQGSIEALEIHAKLDPTFDAGARFELAPGALSGLLASDDLIVGVSSRWTGHEQAVKLASKRVRAETAKVPFLLQGIADDLANKLITAMKSWNGRFAVGIAGGHVLVGYGSDNPGDSGRAVTSLLETVEANVDIARVFTSDVPSVKMSRKVADVDGQAIHKLSIGQAIKFVPREARGLLRKDGALEIAMTFSDHNGAGMLAIGPAPVDRLKAWTREARSGAAGASTLDVLAAAKVAVDPLQLTAIDPANVDPMQILNLTPSGPRRTLELKQPAPGELHLRIETSGGAKMASSGGGTPDAVRSTP